MREFLQNRFMQDQQFGPFGSIANRAHHIAVRIEMAFKDHSPTDILGGRRGGYLCVAEGDTGNPHFTVLVGGSVSQEKLPKYYRLAHEKAVRLARNPKHISSFQSRDGKERFGGAVRTLNGWILSFSGFPELIDEALVLVQMRMSIWPDNKKAAEDIRVHCAKIADLSGNGFYPNLARWCDIHDF